MKIIFYIVLVYLTPPSWSLNYMKEMTDLQRIIMDEMTWNVKLIFFKKYLEDRDKNSPDVSTFEDPNKNIPDESVFGDQDKKKPDLQDSRRYVDLPLAFQKLGFSGSDFESEKQLNTDKQKYEDTKLERRLSHLIYSLVKEAKQKKQHRPEMLILLLDKL